MNRIIMQMLAFWNKFYHCHKGVSAIEFALSLPFMLTLMTIILDLGNAYLQSAEIEKGLRAGALYAAHMAQPLSGIEEMAVINLVKTGTLDGTGDYLVPGYATTGDVFVTDSEYLMTAADPALGSPNLPVVLVNAQVPYAPILPGLWDFIGVSDFTFNLSHEQAYVGL